MANIVKVDVKEIDSDRLIELGVKLGRATGWTEFWIEKEGDEDEPDDARSTGDYITVAVSFETEAEARAFAGNFTPM